MKLRKIANNVTVLELDGKSVLISYETPVAVLYTSNGNYVVTSKKWSATTQRHINSWIPNKKALQVTEEPQEYFDELLNVEK